MQTLRIKLIIPADSADHAARAIFTELSQVHEDQAIFQVNQTEYISDDEWGFRIQYDTKLYVEKEFIQSTSLMEIEQVMTQVAPQSFEQRITSSEDNK